MRCLLLSSCLVFCYLSSFAQGSIVGIVKDSEGPLQSAVVVVGNTNKATVTNEYGRFTFENLPAGVVQLMVSFVGYKNEVVEVTVENDKTATVEVHVIPDVLGLDEVVVSASRYEQNRREAPVRVDVIGQKTLNLTQSVNLAEGLNFQPGLRVETNCQNCGFTQVRMNGLEGPYTQILVNSRPVFSALVGVYGLEQIPVYMIDRIEVVKGGGSALYGSNAIAGTINIITKEPVLNTWEVKSNYASIDGQSNDFNHIINGAYVSNDLAYGISGFASLRSRESYDANGDGFTEMVELESASVGTKFFYKPRPSTKLTLDASLIDEYRRGGNLLSLPPEYTDITEQLDHNIVMGGLNVDQILNDGIDKLSLYGSIQHTNRDSYYGGLGGSYTAQDSLLAANAYGETTDQALVSGVQWNHANGSTHAFISGVELQHNTTDDRIPGYNRTVDQQVTNLGAFIQWEWQTNDRLKLLSGVRFDQSKVSGLYELGDISRSIENKLSVLSPRFTMLYDLSQNWQFRGGYARGFRAPQAFNEDLHISSAGGEPLFVIISDGLDKESSDAFTGSFSYTQTEASNQISLVIEGFYNRLNNPFVLVNTGSQLPNGSLVEEVRNGEGAYVTGVNLELNYATQSWTYQSGFTLQQSRYVEEQVLFEPEGGAEGSAVVSDEFMRMPNHYGFFNVSYSTEKDWQFSFVNVLTGPMKVPEILQSTGQMVIRNSDWFWDSTIKVAHHFHLGSKLHLEASAGVQNLWNSYQSDFQTGPTRDSDYIYGPGRPRTYFVGLKIGNRD